MDHCNYQSPYTHISH